METTPLNSQTEPRASWMPLIVIILTQILMSFNVSTLQVSIEGIASSFNASATTVGTPLPSIFSSESDGFTESASTGRAILRGQLVL